MEYCAEGLSIAIFQARPVSLPGNMPIIPLTNVCARKKPAPRSRVLAQKRYKEDLAQLYRTSDHVDQVSETRIFCDYALHQDHCRLSRSCRSTSRCYRADATQPKRLAIASEVSEKFIRVFQSGASARRRYYHQSQVEHPQTPSN